MTDVDPVDYTPYLDSHLWPSSSTRMPDGSPTPQHAEDFPPQQAAASLAKLLRWARANPERVAAWSQPGAGTLIDADDAELAVRLSYLGQNLAARALNMHDINLLAGVHQDPDDLPPGPQPADVRAVLTLLFDALCRTNPVANQADIGRLAGELTGLLYDNYAVYERT